MTKPRRSCLYIAFIFLLFTSWIIPTHQNKYSEDFLHFWTDVKDNYAYFNKKHTDWDKVRLMYQPLAAQVNNREELITVFEKALAELYDDHFSLNTNLQSSPRLVPTGLDVWAEWINDKAIITEIRPGFSADKAGALPGMEIISMNDAPVAEAVNNKVGKCISPIDASARNYALRQLLAGTYVTKRILTVKHNGKIFTLDLDNNGSNLTDNHHDASLLESRTIDNNIGYIKFNNSLGETDVISAFDSVLLSLKNTKALIIDLRETPSGGNAFVARAIMSRFISKEMPYQKHVLPAEEKEYGVKRSWIEIVSPRRPFMYSKTLVVLVDHWTGSMGEGITIGFDAMNRATIVGTKMAGLNGAIDGFSTPELKIPYSFPTEQLYHINGTAREFFTPSRLIDFIHTSYKAGSDPILAEGINIINKKSKPW